MASKKNLKRNVVEKMVYYDKSVDYPKKPKKPYDNYSSGKRMGKDGHAMQRISALV